MGKFICLCGKRCVVYNADKVQCPNCKQKYYLGWKYDEIANSFYIATILKHENINHNVAR